jgi:hypothetical protein
MTLKIKSGTNCSLKHHFGMHNVVAQTKPNGQSLSNQNYVRKPGHSLLNKMLSTGKNPFPFRTYKSVMNSSDAPNGCKQCWKKRQENIIQEIYTFHPTLNGFLAKTCFFRKFLFRSRLFVTLKLLCAELPLFIHYIFMMLFAASVDLGKRIFLLDNILQFLHR